MAVDADTKKHLEEARKGKPRKFVMICKGVKILSLIVYKKGTVESFKKKAKEAGHGQFYHGVITGKGQNISFQLAQSDGYENPPSKELILKDFLNSNTDMKFKPVYELVERLEEYAVKDEKAEDDPTPAGTTTEGEEEVFRKRLTALKPNLQNALKSKSSQAKELQRLVNAMRKFIGESTFAEANDLLDQIEQVIEFVTKEITAKTREDLFFTKTRFHQIAPSLQADFAPLRRGIREMNYDDAPDELSDLLENRYQAFCSELRSQICAAIESRDQMDMKKIKERVSKDSLIHLLIRNPFTQGQVFEQTITDALDEIETKLSNESRSSTGT